MKKKKVQKWKNFHPILFGGDDNFFFYRDLKK